MKRSIMFAAAIALAACSSDPEDAAPIVAGGAPAVVAPTDCFSVNAISGFTTVDSDTIRVQVGASDTYEIDGGGASCANLGFANQIAIDPDPLSSRVCVGDGPLSGRIRTDQGDSCAIEAVRRYTEPTPVGASPATP